MIERSNVVAFPARTRPRSIDELALARLGTATDELTALRLATDIETHNLTHSTGRLSPAGSIMDGRALAAAARLILVLVDLRGNPQSDHILTQAARRWLDERRNRMGR